VSGNEDPPATDKHGNPLSASPDPTEHGRLLGFNFAGNAAYATNDSVTLATLELGEHLRVPPRERWLAGEFPLGEVGLTPGDYVLYAADEGGPWRALTNAAREGIADRGVDPTRVLRDAAAVGDPDRLVAALNDDDPKRTTAASEELRRLVADRPDAFVDHLQTVLDVLRHRLHGEAGLDAEPAGGDPDRTDSADSTHALFLRNVAFAVARLVRESPAAGVRSADRLLASFDENQDRTEDAVHRELLVDAVDVLVRRRTTDFASVLADRLEREADSTSVSRVRLLNALYHLEQRYATGNHPVVEDPTLRGAVDRAVEGPNPDVTETAEAVRTVHDFHG
jgi:hypothetical protein